MRRLGYDFLQSWKNNKKRKPLIIRGARQVGKTFLVHEFGKKEFPHIHVFNFQKDRDIHSLFEENIEPKKIIKVLADYSNKKIDIERDLIFFDEIQDCPKALTSLKYFFEDMRGAFLIAAGSLLGIHLNETSFPVGKVEFLNLFPLNFIEFLYAREQNQLIEYLQSKPIQIPELIHTKLNDELKDYLVVGGAPEVVTTYLETLDFIAVRKKQNELLHAYRGDFAKHSGQVNAMSINQIFESIPNQLAKDNKKFSFKLLETGSRFTKYRTAIEWLIGADLVYKVPIINHIETPLKSLTSENSFKLYFFDIGLLGALSELPTQAFVAKESWFKTFKGAFMENLFLQEFKSHRTESIYCWQGKLSEIEFVFQNESGLFPIEVKSGTSGRLRSLNIFSEKYHATQRTRVSMLNFIQEKKSSFVNLPLYLSSRV
jgi:predicted AAA+ superfamily ATPase